jgi:hypothetical protein
VFAQVLFRNILRKKGGRQRERQEENSNDALHGGKFLAKIVCG